MYTFYLTGHYISKSELTQDLLTTFQLTKLHTYGMKLSKDILNAAKHSPLFIIALLASNAIQSMMMILLHTKIVNFASYIATVCSGAR